MLLDINLNIFGLYNKRRFRLGYCLEIKLTYFLSSAIIFKSYIVYSRDKVISKDIMGYVRTSSGCYYSFLLFVLCVRGIGFMFHFLNKIIDF